jgi:hypothetical protein
MELDGDGEHGNGSPLVQKELSPSRPSSKATSPDAKRSLSPQTSDSPAGGSPDYQEQQSECAAAAAPSLVKLEQAMDSLAL